MRAIVLALALCLLQACNGLGEIKVEPPSTFPYNPRW
jgi:hypothetical protein